VVETLLKKGILSKKVVRIYYLTSLGRMRRRKIPCRMRSMEGECDGWHFYFLI